LTVAITILPLRLRCARRFGLFRLDVGDQVGDRLLHHAGALDHLRQEHLAGAEQVADDVHAVHQRALDHVQRRSSCWRASSVSALDELGDALDQRVLEPLGHRPARARPGRLGSPPPPRRGIAAASSSSRSVASGGG
jgi:hypothetical protein